MALVVKSRLGIFWRSTLIGVTGLASLLALVTAADAQTVDQTLDSIVVTSSGQPRGIVQSPVVAPVYYTSNDDGSPSTPLSGATDFSACQGIGTLGLYCLATTTGGRAIVRWDNPDRSGTPGVQILCTSLGLQNCTAMTVNLSGKIFVAGQPTGLTSYALVKVVPIAQCAAETGAAAPPPSAPWFETADHNFCYRYYASGRPRIHDLSMVDGALVAGFLGQGPGVLSLEDTAPGQVVFYADRQGVVAPVLYVASNKWGNLLGSTEYLQGLTLLQQPTASPARNFVMVASSTGKVIGYELPWPGGSTNVKPFATGLVLNATTLAATVGTETCVASATATYDLRASTRTRRLFFTANNCVGAYDPTITTNKVPVTFPNKAFGIATESTFALSSVTVSPGIEIDFVRDQCVTAEGCDVIKRGNEVAANVYNIQLQSQSVAGWVVYQITGMPDCRYIPGTLPAICNGAVSGPPGDPTKQSLDITHLFPPEITDTVPPCTATPGLAPPACLPPMWLQPDYRARETIPGTTGRANYTFDALLGFPENDLIYRGTFNATFDIGDLLGSELSKLGCGGTVLPAYPTTQGQNTSLKAPPWDPVVNISELAPTVGGPTTGTNHASMLLNHFCENPSSLIGGRGSAFLYALERAPNTRDSEGRWHWYDSSFALLMRSLAKDYDTNLNTYACTDLDPDLPLGDPNHEASMLPPLSPDACYNLKKDWKVTYDKLLNCVNATDQPKNSSGKEACNSFETQWDAYEDEALAVTRYGWDQYNRTGEFIARTRVLWYVYKFQLQPSLKPGGFVNPNVPN